MDAKALWKLVISPMYMYVIFMAMISDLLQAGHNFGVKGQN